MARTLDVYDAACLAGGPQRVVDTALVVALERGDVSASDSGRLVVCASSRSIRWRPRC